jgi:hypothetical protein
MKSNALRAASPLGESRKIKGLKKSFDEWTVSDALHCVLRSAAIKKDPELMAAIRKMAISKKAEKQLEAKNMAALAAS